jgi:hypothetical protein
VAIAIKTIRALAQNGKPARFYADSLHDSDALKLLVNLFGARRVALGSAPEFLGLTF